MGSSLPPEAFGRYLQAIRLEKGISLEQVAAQTRISILTLKAIEHEEFNRLPAEVFLKGFLRAFAGSVGAEGDEAVRRYAAHRALVHKTEGVGSEPQRDRSASAGRLAALLALLAILVAGSISGWHYATRTPIEAPPTVAFTATEPVGIAPGTGFQPGAPAPAAAAAELKLVITAQESTWVKVVTDQGTPREHTLRAGQQVKLEARSHFNLLIGNAGAVKLSLNNTPVAVPGKRGEPVNLHLP
jgi:transcriptional regulator with XRE-family HTH domain